MFPHIPENLGALSAEELRTLHNEIQAALAAFKAEKPIGERTDEEVEAGLKAIDDAKAVFAAYRRARLSEEEPTDEIPEPPAGAEPETEAADQPDHDEQPDKDDESDDDTEAEPEAEPEAADQTPAPSGMSTGARPVNGSAASRAPRIVLREDLGVARDMTNATWTELAMAIRHKVDRIGASDQRYPVATIERTYPDVATLGQDTGENYSKLTATMTPDLTAALCGPLVEIVSVADIPLNTARSVTPGLPNYNASAANIRVWQAPAFSDTDFDAGVGQWTSTDDAAVTLTGGPRKTCFEIECPTAVDYDVYAVWSCIEISNMLQISFPQLITRYQDIGMANHSQLADDLALTFIRAATAIDYKDGAAATDPAYGAYLRMLRLLVRARADYIQAERYQEGVRFDAWAPKSLAWFFVLDLMSRRTTNGSNPVYTPSDITGAFSRLGFDFHWYEDPTFTLSQLTSGVYHDDTDIDLVIRAAPKGKFRFVDKGRLNVGVMPGGFRDSDLVERNRFRVFFETFETVIDTMAAPAVDLNLNNVCANGVQIDDEQMTCIGVAG